MNRNDLRVEKTENSIFQALEKLMLKYEDYKCITVSELCREANINRKTFYIHYNDISEVFVKVQDEISDKFQKKIDASDLVDDPKKVIEAFFALIEENPVYEKIVNNYALDYFREEVERKVFVSTMSKTTPNNEIGYEKYGKFIERFYHMTAISIYREWINEGKKTPHSQVIEIISTLIKNGISGVKSLE